MKALIYDTNHNLTSYNPELEELPEDATVASKLWVTWGCLQVQCLFQYRKRDVEYKTNKSHICFLEVTVTIIC